MAEKNTATGPLQVYPENPRYFADGSGKAIYLTGSHTWANLQDQLSPDPDVKFDFDAYLNWMSERRYNFMRGWAWEQAAWDNHTTEKLLVNPVPYQRTGPGTALDGEPKFDLTQFNPRYFDRLRRRVIAAGQRGIYVSIMLFQGFSVDDRNSTISGNPWRGHPFNVENNINGIDGDPGHTGGGRATHTLDLPEVSAVQDAYVRQVVDTVNDLDNVLYEIGNEHYGDSVQWQYHLIDMVHAYESTKPKQHPVGMTGGGPQALDNAALFNSPADWISPRHEQERPYRDDPPPADGSKVILTDTDHLWGHGGSQGWVWKSLTRGLNPLLMDPYQPLYGIQAKVGAIHWPDHPVWEPVRRNLTYALEYANRLDLAKMIPRGDLCSTGYCLADPGVSYLVYLPDGGVARIDLFAVTHELKVEWFSPTTGETVPDKPVTVGASQPFGAPFAGDAVVFLYS